MLSVLKTKLEEATGKKSYARTIIGRDADFVEVSEAEFENLVEIAVKNKKNQIKVNETKKALLDALDAGEIDLKLYQKLAKAINKRS